MERNVCAVYKITLFYDSEDSNANLKSHVMQHRDMLTVIGRDNRLLTYIKPRIPVILSRLQ